MKKIIFLFIIFGLTFSLSSFAFHKTFEYEKLEKEDKKNVENSDASDAFDIGSENIKDNNEIKKSDNEEEQNEEDIIEIMPKSHFIFPKQQAAIDGKIDITIGIKDASSVEFHSRRPESLISTYIGRAQSNKNNIWKLEFNTTQHPNGTYNLFPKITNEYGGYTGKGITIKIKNIVEEKIEKEKELKQKIKEAGEEIEKEDKKIEEEQKKSKKEIKKEIDKSIEKTENIIEEPEKEIISSEVKKEKEKANKEIDKEINKMADKIKEAQELKKEIKEKEDEKEKTNEKIKQTQKELENLPELPIPVLKKDKQEKLNGYKKEKKEIKKEIEDIEKKLGSIQIEKNNSKKKIIKIVEKVVKPIKDTSETKVKSQIRDIEEKTKIIITKNLEKLETSIIGAENNKIKRTKTLLKDSDQDGISDAEEIRLNTNPLNPDSDNDGFLDGVEYVNGFNPLDPSPAKKIVYQDPRKAKPKKSDIYIIEQVKTESLPYGQIGLKIKGKGLPNSFVTLYIFSEPIVMVVKTDEKGNWEYILDKQIADGQHIVYAAVTNNTGEIEAKSEPFVFTKSGNKVFRIFESVHLAEISSPIYALEKGYTILIAAIVILNIMLALLLIGVLAKRKKEI